MEMLPFTPEVIEFINQIGKRTVEITELCDKMVDKDFAAVRAAYFASLSTMKMFGGEAFEEGLVDFLRK